MAPPPRPYPLKKSTAAELFKRNKPLTLSETAGPGGKPSALVPNIRSIAWSPTGSMVANSMAANVRVWNPERPDVKLSTELKDGARSAHSSTVEKVAFCPTMDSVLGTSGADGMVKVWDVRTPQGAVGGGYGAKGSVTGKSGEHKVGDSGLFLTWHPSGTEMLVGRRDDKCFAIDMRKATPTILEPGGATANASASMKYTLAPADRSPAKDKGAFNQMTFSNTGREVFATTQEGPVKILDYPSMQVLYTLNAHTSATYAVQQSPMGNYIAVGSADGLITLWDTGSWLVSHVLTNQTSATRDLSFSFDGSYLVGAAGSGDKDGDKGLHVYHVDSGESAGMVETNNAVTQVAWHPLRHAVAYGGDPGGLKIVGLGDR